MFRYCIFLIAALFVSISTASAGDCAKNAQDLLVAFQQAYAEKAAGKLVSLVRFHGGSETAKRSWREDFSKEIGQSNSKISLTPFSLYSAGFPDSVRDSLPKSYQLINWLVVEFPTKGKPNSYRQESSLYLVAVENGAYFIVGP